MNKNTSLNHTKKLEFGRWETSYKDINESNQNLNKNLNINTHVFSCPVDHFGTTVYVKGWRIKTPKIFNPVIFVHDIAQNMGLYTKLANYFVQKRINFFCFDLRGHGCSGRLLGHIDSFENFVNDLLQISALIKHICEGHLPIIFGQGLGALITTAFANKYPKFCKGIIISCPSYKFSLPLNRFKKFIINFVADIYPRAKLPFFLYSRLLGYQKNINLESIPLDTKKLNIKFTAKFLREILDAMSGLENNFLNLTSQTLLIYPKTYGVFDLQNIDDMLNVHPHRDKIKVINLQTLQHSFLTNNFIDNNLNILQIIDEWIQNLS